MIRTCPKCRDFYADDLLLFCLADGTPLVVVEPHNELWSEGQRVVAEKENARRKKERVRRWRRVALASMTMMIVVAVIFVVTVNGIIYLKPQAEDESARAESSTPFAPDSPDPSFISPRQQQPEAWSRPTPTPVAAPKPTPTPTPRIVLSATPTPTPTPLVDATPSEPTETATCTGADKRREMEAIVKSFGQSWRRTIEGERERIIAENSRGARQGVEATLSALEYSSSFFKECKAGVVIVRYVWQLRINVNGAVRVVSVPKERKFACMKIGGAWLCR